jgi:cytochrome P450
MLLLAAPLAVAALFYIFAKYSIRADAVFGKPSNAPGPKGLWFIGSIPEIARYGEFHIAARAWADKYGKVFQAVLLGRLSIFVSDLDLLKRILVTDNFPKSKYYEDLAHIFGLGIVFSNGDLWKRHKKIVAPGFADGHLRMLVPTFAAHGEKMVARLSALVAAGGGGGVVDAGDAFTRATLDIICDVGFGYDLGAVREGGGTNECAAAFTKLLSLSSNPGVLLRGIVEFVKFYNRRHFAALNKVLDACIDARVREGGRSDGNVDLLDLLLKAGDDGDR